MFRKLILVLVDKVDCTPTVTPLSKFAPPLLSILPAPPGHCHTPLHIHTRSSAQSVAGGSGDSEDECDTADTGAHPTRIRGIGQGGVLQVVTVRDQVPGLARLVPVNVKLDLGPAAECKPRQDLIVFVMIIYLRLIGNPGDRETQLQ